MLNKRGKQPEEEEQEEEDSSDDSGDDKEEEGAAAKADVDNNKVDAITKAFKGVNLNVAQSFTGWDGDKGAFAKGLPEFDYTSILDDAFVLNIGKRRHGKTTNTDHIMWNKQHCYPVGIVFTHTKFNGFWQKRVPAKYIHETYDPGVLNGLFQRNKKILEDPEQDNVNPWAFVILDDCVSQHELMHDTALKELASAGRHYKIFTIINTQYAYGINPLIRGNADYVFLFKQAQRRQRDAVAEDYMDSMPKKDALKVLDTITKVKHQMLVVDVDAETLSVAHCPGPDKLSDEQKHYKLGCREFWGDENY